ncbi:MAG: hypothetical protein D3906_08340 [Candidatus Electrothrix sp. AUS1_2]|nr:hypothetical protein [Candidatus Electrothrix sp. AUS1_2]
MSLFLQNLIARHQKGGVGTGSASVHLVRPRLKARFESEPGRAELGGGVAGTGFDLREEVTATKEYRQVEKPSLGKEPDNGFSLLHSNRQTLPTAVDKAKPHQKVPVLQSEQHAAFLHQRSPDAFPQSMQKLAEQKSHFFDFSGNQRGRRSGSRRQETRQGGIDDTFKQRMQEIMHRLQAEQPQQNTPEKEPDGTLNSPVSLETDKTMRDASGRERPVQAPLLAEPPVNPPHQSGREILGAKHSKQKSEDRQEGLLQTPDWLQEMELDLDKLRQPDSRQTQSESIINVTIGRVEVRATLPPTGGKPKTRQQPSGVMSLDDYLKQRERRG